jgi:hypothetical protein
MLYVTKMMSEKYYMMVKYFNINFKLALIFRAGELFNQ